MTHDRILILDFGSQVTQLIARRVREAHVYCEVHPNDVSESFIREFNPKGIATDTLGIHILRRGVIGVSEVGYI